MKTKGLETLAAQEIRDPGAVTNAWKTKKNLGRDRERQVRALCKSVVGIPVATQTIQEGVLDYLSLFS